MEAYSLWSPPSPNIGEPSTSLGVVEEAATPTSYNDAEMGGYGLDIGARDEAPVIGLDRRINDYIEMTHDGRYWVEATTAAVHTGYIDLDSLEREAQRRLVTAQTAVHQTNIMSAKLSQLIEHFKSAVPPGTENLRITWNRLVNISDIGKGGHFCRVLRGDVDGRVPVAIKVPRIDPRHEVRSEAAVDGLIAERFIFARQLRHPCVLSLVGWGMVPGDVVIRHLWSTRCTDLPFLALEWQDLCLLDVLIRFREAGQMIPTDFLWYWAEGIAWGLHHLHTQKILHRDVKTANVLLSVDILRPMLADFGLSCHVEGDVIPLAHGAIQKPTPPELDPKTNKSPRPGPEADVWGLGVALWELGAQQEASKVDCLNIDDSLLGQLVASCCHTNPASRPTAGQVGEWIVSQRGQGLIPDHPTDDKLGLLAQQLVS